VTGQLIAGIVGTDYCSQFGTLVVQNVSQPVIRPTISFLNEKQLSDGCLSLKHPAKPA